MWKEAAAIDGAGVAADGNGIATVHSAVLASLGDALDDYVKTELEYFDSNMNGTADVGIDSAIVSVIIPMERTGPQYRGFLGGNITDLHLRAVSQRPITTSFSLTPPP